MDDELITCVSEKPAKLVRSMNGGTLLVYVCGDCGTELFRTKEQAEQDEIK